MIRRKVLLLASLALLPGPGCSNAGEDRILSVGATGVVRGFVYFDVNGNRVADAPDDSVNNIRVRLLTRITRDTIASALTDVRGFYRIADVPVGTYVIALDTVPLVDTAVVAQQDSAEVTVKPSDSVHVNIGVSWPHVTAAQARALVPGRRVFVSGIVLNALTNFRDTTMHVQDASAGIRLTRVLATAVGPGDSVRLQGTTARRQISPTVNQPTLDNVTVFLITQRFLPTATTLTTALAATAAGGVRDAQQIQVLDATISDTARVGGDFQLTVNDGSGALEVLLDLSNISNFGNPPGTCPGPCWIPGNTFDIVGIMVPTATAGIWRLKPRSSAELVRQ